jgi:hypothetical protein
MQSRLNASGVSRFIQFVLWIGAGLVGLAVIRTLSRRAPSAAISTSMFPGTLSATSSAPSHSLSAPKSRLSWLARFLLSGSGIILLCLLAESNGKLLKIDGLMYILTSVQFIWLVGGVLLIGIGLSGQFFPTFSLSPLEGRVLIGVLVLALVVRVWNLENSVFIGIDEHGPMETVNQVRTNEAALLVPFWEIAGWSKTFGVIQSIGVTLFGANWTGLRVVSALVGTLTVLALFFMTNHLFDRRVALLAALWLATFPPHVHFSRLAMPNIADPLCGLVALGLVARGWNQNKFSDFVWAGVALGLVHYFYEGGRLLFSLLMVVLGLYLFFFWRSLPIMTAQNIRSSNWSIRRKGLLTMSLAAILVAAPIYYTLRAHSISTTARLSQTNVATEFTQTLRNDPVAFVVRYLAPPFLHYISFPDQSNLYYGGMYGLILPLFVPFFLVSIVYALRHWKQPGWFMLLVWIGGTALGNSLIEQNVFSARYIAVLPALALMIAAGMSIVFNAIWWHLGESATLKRAFYSLTVLLALSQLVYYFGPHLEIYNHQIREYNDFNDIVVRSLSFSPDVQIHIIPWHINSTSDWQIEVMYRYYGREFTWDIVQNDQFTDDYLAMLPHDVDHAFFVLPGDQPTTDRIRQHFVATPPQPSPHNIPLEHQYYLIYAPAEEQSLS